MVRLHRMALCIRYIAVTIGHRLDPGRRILLAVCEKMLPGFGEAMRAASLKIVPTAILSRQTAGIRGRTLIVNLPGRPKSIRENLEAVFPAIPYCIDLIGGPRLEATSAAPAVFRPKA